MLDLLPSAGPALVVGGGAVAARKVRTLAEAEFRITVTAPDVLEEIRLAPWVTIHERPFAPEDLEAAEPRYAVVFACTDSREVNREVGRLARRLNIPVVVADRQGESTCFTPATLRDGDLAVAVSTGGASPELARRIREKILAALGPGWGRIVFEARVAREERLRKQRAARGEGE